MEDRTGETRACPTCNGVMAIHQTMDGAVFVCGCGDEIPAIDLETITE